MLDSNVHVSVFVFVNGTSMDFVSDIQYSISPFLVVRLHYIRSVIIRLIDI